MTYRKDFLTGLLCIDLETTSVEPPLAEIIETATLFGDAESADPRLYKPRKGIPPEVSAVTYLTDRYVAARPYFEVDEERVQETFLFKLDCASVYAAHNIAYEVAVLKNYDIELKKPTLCTLRMAKKYYYNDDSITAYNLPYLRYALNLPVDSDLKHHRAEPDCIIALALINHLLDKLEEDGIIVKDEEYLPQIEAWLDEPIWVKEMPMGKHKGKPLADVPMDYWEWAIGNLDSLKEDSDRYDPDFAASVEKAIEEHLNL